YQSARGNSDKSMRMQNRGEVTLEVYDEMPHIFQVLFMIAPFFFYLHHPVVLIKCTQMFSIWKPAKTAFARTGDFISRVTDPNNADNSVFNAFRVTVDGKFLPLNEDEYTNVLNWDQVGKLPQSGGTNKI